LDEWLHGLFAHPRRDWRDQLDQYFDWQESEGRIATPESRQSLTDYLKWWAVSIGLEEPGLAPTPVDETAEVSAWTPSGQLPDPPAANEPPEGNPAPFGPLIAAFEEETRWQLSMPSYAPELPPKLEWKPRVVKIERLKGFWDDYRELVASGHYEQGWWEWWQSVGVRFTSALLPSSEPSIKITFDDGTVLIVLGGGPESGALGAQATFFIGVHGATVGAATLRQAVFSAFKHLGREAAEQIADSVVQEVTGLPVGPTALLPKKGRSLKSRGRARPSKPRPTNKVQRRPPDRAARQKVRRNPLHDVIEGRAQKTGTTGHAFRTYRQAIRMAKSGRYDKIWLNRAYSTTTGTKTMPRRLPDVIGRRKTGQFDAFEVPSTTDRDLELIRRNLEAMDQLPESQRGSVLLAPILR
jgi:hypothetical protein